MLTILKIECIGNPRLGFQPSWVRLVVSLADRGLNEQWLKGQSDYSHANSVGSRGVFKYYFLRENEIYHVSSPETWKRVDQYYCRIENGAILRMSIGEVIEWFAKRD